MSKTKKYVLPILAMLTSGYSVASEDPLFFKELVQANKYEELRVELSVKRPDVLDRSAGLSIFDYALKQKDKRASIIIAEYHNKKAHSEELKAFYTKLNNVKEQLESTRSDRLERAVRQMLVALKDVREKTEVLRTIQVRDMEVLNDKITGIEADKITKEDVSKLIASATGEISTTVEADAQELQITKVNLDKVVAELMANDQDLLGRLSNLEGGSITKEDIDRFIASSVAFEKPHVDEMKVE